MKRFKGLIALGSVSFVMLFLAACGGSSSTSTGAQSSNWYEAKHIAFIKDATQGKPKVWFVLHKDLDEGLASLSRTDVPDDIIVTENGKATTYDAVSKDFGELSKMSDKQIIKEAKTDERKSFNKFKKEVTGASIDENDTDEKIQKQAWASATYHAPKPRKIKAIVTMDKTGNKVSKEDITFNQISYLDSATASMKKQMHDSSLLQTGFAFEGVFTGTAGLDNVIYNKSYIGLFSQTPYSHGKGSSVNYLVTGINTKQLNKWTAKDKNGEYKHGVNFTLDKPNGKNITDSDDD
ncbi:hypothetical protein [Lacticaseibacillus sp. GG6-2]